MCAVKLQSLLSSPSEQKTAKLSTYIIIAMLQREMHRLERVIYYSFYRAIKRCILTDLESSKVLLKVLFSLLFLAALPVLAVLPEKNTKIRKTFKVVAVKH